LFLFSVQLDSHGRRSQASSYDDECPKFYKEDLLAILEEKNELKEELEAVREELKASKV